MDTTPSTTNLRRVCVAPLPAWVELTRFLGPYDWRPQQLVEGVRAEAELPAREAALLEARLRGLGLDGQALRVEVTPPLPRALVRAARLEEARARRQTTPGFQRPDARASGEGRFSLTPEALALPMAAEARGRSVVDACCGSGGNAIAFARQGCRVIAIDLAGERLAEARHNARVYGVEQQITFIQGDAREQLAQQRADLLFLDPPWGGEYDKRATTLDDFPLLSALRSRPALWGSYAELWLKLPGSFATRSLPDASVRAWFGEAPGDRQRVKFVQLAWRPARSILPP